MSSASHGAFPFDHHVLVNVLIWDCRGLRRLTGSHGIVHEMLRQGEAYARASQCSVQKALEKVCASLCTTFGPSVHPRFWRAVKALSRGGNGSGGYKDAALRSPHPYAPSVAASLVVDESSYGEPVWVISSEPWLSSPRPWMDTGEPK